MNIKLKKTKKRGGKMKGKGFPASLPFPQV